MNGPTLLEEKRVFREAEYLTFYPGVAEAIEAGVFKDAWAHYVRHGRAEGRRICQFDEKFYLDRYPSVALEIAAGRATSAPEHFVVLGWGRGYLPHATAERPGGPAGDQAPFGGLWTDAADALDRVHGRYATGQITADQSAQLASFVRDGCVLLSNAIPDALIDTALVDFDRAWRGEAQGLRFECRAAGRAAAPWLPVVTEGAAKALDIHYFSKAIRALIFAPSITGLLTLIFESTLFASQTQGFLRGAAEGIHQDTAFVPYTHPASFVASWIALEDVTAGAGELYYYEGSHRLPQFLYNGKFRSLHEARRVAATELFGPQIENHARSLSENINRYGIERKSLLAKRGDVFIGHADLVYGGAPISAAATRKSIVTHYCPTHVAPLFCELHKVGYHGHEGHAFTSSHYAGMAPAG